MLVSQFTPVTHLIRDHLSVLGKLINGPVVLAQRSKPTAVLLSVNDYEKLVADSEAGRRYLRMIAADQAREAGDFVELTPAEILALV
ncbi:MAG: type II toxin-antitoxin system Phd/YefM family antitoxin [Chloroflexota bacterium]|nr:type II toxin-antitoxin system Phd/YefM family antitoxin [Chloroflexota bacterium]